MDPALNPFAPGSGVRPPELVGRQSEIDAFDLLVVRAKSNTMGDRGMVLSGLRGVGKTVLLNVFAEQARRNHWMVIQLEAQPGVEGMTKTRAKLARELEMGARRLRGTPVWSYLKDALGSISNISGSLGVAGFSASVATKHGRADSGKLDIDVEELVEDVSVAMRKARAGFGLFIDEMQDLDEELLTVLLSVQHLAGQRGWPFYIIGAGLPNLPGKIAEARTYGERLFLYRTIGQLDKKSSADALTVPIGRLGASITERALSTLRTGTHFFFRHMVVQLGILRPAKSSTKMTRSWRSNTEQSISTTGSSKRGGREPRQPSGSIYAQWPKTVKIHRKRVKSQPGLGNLRISWQ